MDIDSEGEFARIAMSPGINDGSRSTGTLPKSNRRNDRNRERSAANQRIANHSSYEGQAQHFNNLVNLFKRYHIFSLLFY